MERSPHYLRNDSALLWHLVNGRLSNGDGFAMSRRLEQQLSARLHGAPVVAVSSGTAALAAALAAALGHGTRRTVLLPAIGFHAAALAVEHVGATVAFVDTDADGLIDIDKAALFAHANPNIAAVVGIDEDGRRPRYDRLRDALPDHVKLIEDAAPALGTLLSKALDDGTRCATATATASYADMVTFSFHETKILGGCEGGAVAVTADAEPPRSLFVDRLKALRYFGETPGRSTRYTAYRYGFNYKMGALHAALVFDALSIVDGRICRAEAVSRRLHGRHAFCPHKLRLRFDPDDYADVRQVAEQHLGKLPAEKRPLYRHPPWRGSSTAFPQAAHYHASTQPLGYRPWLLTDAQLDTLDAFLQDHNNLVQLCPTHASPSSASATALPLSSTASPSTTFIPTIPSA